MYTICKILHNMLLLFTHNVILCFIYHKKGYYMNIDLTCSFFGHRNMKLNNKQIEKLRDVLEFLIVNKNVRVFLFGSRSSFDSLCHELVSHLKEKYPYIKRIAYTCSHETCTLEIEKQKYEELYKNVLKMKVNIACFEEEVEHDKKYISGKASYIERNMAMIDNSDFCIFYYNEKYMPSKRKYSQNCICYYQPNSGTRLAFNYAKRKKKKIINIYNDL